MRVQLVDILTGLCVFLSSLVLTFSDGNPWLCADQYYKYCRSMPSYKCYKPINTKLCCGTCEAYMLKFSSLLENPKCVYGDRVSGCALQPRDQCYETSYRLKCCYTCAVSYSNTRGCEYGDWDKQFCGNIKSYHCYDKKIQEKCCRTCKQYDTGRPTCRYGDQRYYTVMKSRPTHRYNCRAFIGYFGPYRCKWSRYRTFQQKCCGSCHDAEIKLYRRYYG